MFIAGWRHAPRSECPFIVIITHSEKRASHQCISIRWLLLVPVYGGVWRPPSPSACRLQVAECGKDLSTEKAYYQRYRVCEGHLKMLSLVLNGNPNPSRFCQQVGLNPRPPNPQTPTPKP